MCKIMMDFQILGPYDPPTGWKEILGELNNSNTAPPSASASGGIIMKYTTLKRFARLSGLYRKHGSSLTLHLYSNRAILFMKSNGFYY